MTPRILCSLDMSVACLATVVLLNNPLHIQLDPGDLASAHVTGAVI